MDARITVEPMVAEAIMVETVVTTVIKVDDLVKSLVSLFDPAVILAPLLRMGNSVTAVAPDDTYRGGVSVQVSA